MNALTFATTRTLASFRVVSADDPLPVSASVSASIVTTATAADPSLVEGSSTNPLSVDLSGHLRVVDSTGKLVQASAGSDATKAVSVQGITGGKSLPVLVAAGTALIGKVGIDQTTPGTTNAVSATNFPTTAALGHGTAATALRVELPTDGTGVVGLIAGAALIGKVGIDQTTPGTTNSVALDQTTEGTTNGVVNHGDRLVDVAFSTLTRPANTTAYTANDSISDNATAGSVTPISATASDTNDAPVIVTSVRLDTNDTGLAAGVQIRAHIFGSDPTASSGVVGGDNAAWSNKKAGWIGSFSGTFVAFSDGGRAQLAPDSGNFIVTKPGTGAKTLWIQYQTLGAFTPSANSTTIDARLKGLQGRA